MLRHRSLRTAAAAAVTAATRDYATPPSQVWITISGDAQTLCGAAGGGAGKSWTLRVPLEVSTTTTSASKAGSGPTGQGVLHRSRTLLAPHTATPNENNRATTGEAAVRDPYTVSVDDALLGHNGGQQQAATSLRALVQLLVDPDAGNSIEDVSLRDFTAMATKRQLRAVANNAECLDVIVQSERYQGERDARALRLVGITSVGQWHEQPDRVPLSPYGRGILESTYHAMTRTRQQSQQDSVVAWLTRTIQRAVAEELMAPKMLAAGGGQESGSMMHQLHPSSTSAQRAGDKGEHVVLATSAAAAVTAKASQQAEDAARANAKESHEPANDQQEEEEEESDVDATAGGARRRGPRHRPLVSQVDKAAVKTAAAKEAETEDIIDEVAAEQGKEVDAEMATLMAEAEAILGGEEAPAAPKAAGTTATSAAKTSAAAADAAEEEEEVEEVMEEVEEEEMEEVEEDEEAPVAAATTAKAPAPAAPASSTPPTPTVAAAAASTPASPPATNPQQKEKLARLAELMLKQFNTADGYLHPTNKAERKEQEKRGDIVVLDEDTAQVDPLAMFSTYHAATVTEDDPIAVRALKTIWTSYNKHQVALEEAADEAAAEFYKHESVNALLYGSVLMRALAREEPVMVLEGTSMPRYGFPLVSSDTRPFSAAASSSANAKSATDMTPGKVPTAMQAYKIFFNDKEKRYSPFRPAVDHNAGCSVVRLSGTTLHLYYTSTMDHVMEEEVRMPFAEVMLGMLHLLRQKVLPRVNVVHYHLIATKMADAAADTNFMLRSTATLDLTNPFTKEEHTRLKALAAPLGMAEEMDEFRCIDDLVMEIEENSGASVVHSLLHNREDLEATLTATLAQLLPEDADADSAGAAAAATTADVEADDTSGAAAEQEDAEGDEEGAAEEEELEEEEVEEAAEAPLAPPAPAGRKSKAAAVAAAHRTAPAPQPEEEEAVEEEDEAEEEEEYEEDVEEDEEGEAPVQPSQRGGHRQKAQQPAASAAARKPLHHPAPPVAPTTRRTSAAAAAPKGDEDEAELEEAIFSQWRKQKEQQQQHGKHPVSGGGSKSAAASRAAAQQQEEEEEEGEEEEFEEEEYEEEEAPVVTPAANKPRRGTAAAPAAPASSRAAAPKAATPAIEEEEDEEEEVEIVRAPVLPRSPAGRRAVPVAQPAVEDEEDEGELPPAPPRRAQQPPSPQQQQQQRAARHPHSSPAPAPPRQAQPPRAARVEEDAEEGEGEEDAPPPLPLIRTRRGAARRHSSRASAAPQTEEAGEESASVGFSGEDGADGQEAAPAAAAEDQWFRKKPKRRYFE